VLAAGGRSGGFSASGGIVTKLRLLTIEGAQPGGPTLFGALPLAASPRRTP
jgi:methylated-DNA-[protein]-cysteine S-methyltransferase